MDPKRASKGYRSPSKGRFTGTAIVTFLVDYGRVTRACTAPHSLQCGVIARGDTLSLFGLLSFVVLPNNGGMELPLYLAGSDIFRSGRDPKI